MRLLRLVLLLCALVSAITVFASGPDTEYDDCDANFIAFIGSSAYQFAPGHLGELGSVRLFAILSYQRAAHEKRYGPALWQLRIEWASSLKTTIPFFAPNARQTRRTICDGVS